MLTVTLPGGARRHAALLALGAAGTLGALAVLLWRWRQSSEQQPRSAMPHAALPELLAACLRGSVDDVQRLVTAHPSLDVDARDARGHTALTVAAACGHARLVDALLRELRANVARPDGSGLTAVHHAASMGQLGVLQALVAHAAAAAAAAGGARGGGAVATAAATAAVNVARPADGATPLMLAGAEGHVAVVSWLVGMGAAVGAAMHPTGITALHAAAQKDRGKVVRALVAAGAPVDAPCALGRTPLAVAAQYGCEQAADALLACGASPRGGGGGDADPLHASPLAVAARRGHVGVLRALVAAGVAPDAVALRDGRPLLLAAVQGFPAGGGRMLVRPDVVRALLLLGADARAAWQPPGAAVATCALEAGLAAGGDRAVARVLHAWQRGTLAWGDERAPLDEDPLPA